MIETGNAFSGDLFRFPGRCCRDPPPVMAVGDRCWSISADGGGIGRPVRGRSNPPETSLRPHCPRRCSLGSFRNPRSLKRRPATPEDMNASRRRCPPAVSTVSISPCRSVPHPHTSIGPSSLPAGRRAIMSVVVCINRQLLPRSRCGHRAQSRVEAAVVWSRFTSLAALDRRRQQPEDI